ncbi:hypothetical protein BX666DRAFT_2028161 [Dichotomocladium elegans]|nr:hypothetical protein BX666DRAFT_2028161 [Dichotomocladium elegans]
MNILPHKSWHVYNAKNIEKVKRDEARAQAEEEAKAKRVTQAESEARLQLLRERAEKRHVQGDGALISGTVVKKEERLVLFGEDGGNISVGNEERAAEEKEKEDRLERQITMYLDKGATEPAPWYATAESDRFGESTVKDNRPVSEAKQRRRKRAIKVQEDPLYDIRKSLKKREESRKEKRHHSAVQQEIKKDKKKVQSASSSTSSSASIEALRAKRLERERIEKMRTRAYVFGEKPKHPEPQGYSSQFNPSETAEAQKRRQQRRQRH